MPMLVVFDGTCGVCSRAVDWLMGRVEPRRLVALPNQTPGLLKALGLSRAQADRAVWLILRDGGRLHGAAAVNRALRECRSRPWAQVARLYEVRALRRLEDLAYAWIAAHRGRLAFLGVRPFCERVGVDCASNAAVTMAAGWVGEHGPS